jgi:hypothetical protein
MYLLPDSPLTTRWLTPEERTLAFKPIARDTVGLVPHKGAIAGLNQAFGDYLFYIFALMQNVHLSACSYSTTSFRQWLALSASTQPPPHVMICPTYLVSGFSGFADYFVSLNSDRRFQDNMAYFPSYGRSTCVVYHILRRDEYCSTLYRMLSVRHGSV